MATLSPPPGFGAPVLPAPSLLLQERTKRSKNRRVTWATGDKLCQVRLFAAEDAPATSGSIQEQLQPKQARFMHIFNSSVPNLPPEDAPPGFGGVIVKPKTDPAVLAAIVPQISWRRPDVLKLDPAWLVMAGGASKEIALQKQREVRVLEAVYPRPSSIPDSPAEPLEMQETYDDTRTPQIPLVPLEDEDVPDGGDMSSMPGPRFFSQGLTRQVPGAPLLLPKVPTLSNGLLEIMKQNMGDSLAGSLHESVQAKNESVWRDGGAGYKGRGFPADNSSGLLNGRPTLGGPLPEIPVNLSHNGVEPDVAAAAAAALAALSKSNEVGSMIDNNLLIQILKDPSLMQSLTTKQPSSLGNSKSDSSSSLALRIPDNVNQGQSGNSVGPSGSHWVSTQSSAFTGGQDGSKLRIGDGYVNGVERFQRKNGPESLMAATASSGQQLYTETINNRIATSMASRSSSNVGAPPGFGSAPPGFGHNSSMQGTQSTTSNGTASGPSRPLSRHDEQYFKNLIMQHGCKSADDDDHGRAIMEGQGNGGGLRSHGGSEAMRWYGREDEDGVRLDRSRRDSERVGMSLDYVAPRGKSRKVCIYFGTARGCRNGASCTFVHESSDSEKGRSDRARSEPAQMQFVKRLKVDGCRFQHLKAEDGSDKASSPVTYVQEECGLRR